MTQDPKYIAVKVASGRWYSVEYVEHVPSCVEYKGFDTRYEADNYCKQKYNQNHKGENKGKQCQH